MGFVVAVASAVLRPFLVAEQSLPAKSAGLGLEGFEFFPARICGVWLAPALFPMLSVGKSASCWALFTAPANNEGPNDGLF